MNDKFTSSMRHPEEQVPERDDAPRLTRACAEKAELRVGDRIIREADPPVRIGRPRKPVEDLRKPVSIRLSSRVLEAARASGKGWQSRAAAAIEREFLGGDSSVIRQEVGGQSMFALGQTMFAKRAVAGGKAKIAQALGRAAGKGTASKKRA